MREYIVYTILVFFPIGILMNYLLRRQGLIFKYRVAIITASLAIIISFPILMGNLGLPMALVLYFSAILVLTWFFIKATQSPAWYLEREVSTSDEVFASKRLVDKTKVQTVADFEDAAGIEELKTSNLSVSESSVPETNVNRDNDEIIPNRDNFPKNLVPAVEVNSVSESIQDDASNDGTLILDNVTELSTLPDQILSVQVNLEESAALEPNFEETYQTDNLAEAEADHVPNADKQIAADNFAASENFNVVKDLETLTDEPLKIALNEATAQETVAVGDIGGDELTNSSDNITRDDEDDILPILPDLSPTNDSNAILSAENEPGRSDEPGEKIKGLINIDNIMETSETADDNNLRRKDERVNQLIDQAFKLKKAQYTAQALECLAQALEITSDEDLSYLLLMEMVNIYKDMGRYNQAEELLFASIGKAYRRTDIIDAIKRQLSYIRMLSFELDRLGLANTPISEVPRLVRKNVAEFVEI